MKSPAIKRLCERTPDGQKTRKMLEVEDRLGRTLEDDFREYYVEKCWGQQRIAKRWGVKRDLIFHSCARNRSRAWVEILNLAVRRIDEEPDRVVGEETPKLLCELCEQASDHFDRAHWIADKDGGGTESYNILRACPNCHRRLDRGDAAIAEKAKEVLLFREVKRIVEAGGDSKMARRELAKIAYSILNRKVT
jgi:hypothetical protein